MWIEIGNVWSKLARATAAERSWVRDYLTFEPAGYAARVKKPVSMFNTFSNAFPSGFVTMVKKAATEEGMKVELIDLRKLPEVEAAPDLAWLRDYQEAGVVRAVARKRGILWLPTAAGKTEILVGLTRAVPTRWLALVHRGQLADEIASRFEKRTPGGVAGRVVEGNWDVPEEATLVAATYQSIAADLKSGGVRAKPLLRSARAIAVDECHTLPSQSFWKIAMLCSNAVYRIGFSATPLARGDKKSSWAIAALGPVIYRVLPDVLIDLGVLAKPTVRLVPCEQSLECLTWETAYERLVVQSKQRNAVVVDMVERASSPGFIFIKEKAHGRELCRLLARVGIKTEFVHGTHSIAWRKSHIRRLVQGHYDFIVCTKVFDTGIDVPELRSIVNASGGKSIIETLQRLGRGMRVDREADQSVRAGGDLFEVWDVDDRGNKWLSKHAKDRAATYAGEGYETIIEQPPIL